MNPNVEARTRNRSFRSRERRVSPEMKTVRATSVRIPISFPVVDLGQGRGESRGNRPADLQDRPVERKAQEFRGKQVQALQVQKAQPLPRVAADRNQVRREDKEPRGRKEDRPERERQAEFSERGVEKGEDGAERGVEEKNPKQPGAVPDGESGKLVELKDEKDEGRGRGAEKSGDGQAEEVVAAGGTAPDPADGQDRGRQDHQDDEEGERRLEEKNQRTEYRTEDDLDADVLDVGPGGRQPKRPV